MNAKTQSTRPTTTHQGKWSSTSLLPLRWIPALTAALLMALPASLFPDSATGSSVDLARVCNQQLKQDCVRWYVHPNFNQDHITLTADSPQLANWEQPTSFPLWVNKLKSAKLKEGFQELSFLTFFDAPEQLRRSASQPGVLFPEIGEAFTVFVNGQAIATEGVWRDQTIWQSRTVRGVVYDIDPLLLKPTQNALLIVIRGDPRYDHTGFYASQGYTFGSAPKLRYERQDRVALVLVTLYLFVGLYHLLLFWRRRQDRYNLFFGLVGIGIFVYMMTRSDIIFEAWPLLGKVDSILIQRIELAVLYANIPFMFWFLDSLFLQRASLFTKIYTVVCALLVPPTLLLPMHLAEKLLTGWQMAAPIALGYFLYRPIRAKINGNADAGRLLVGITVMMLTVTYDIIDSAVLHTGVSFTKYGFFVFILGIAAILANRFLRVHNQVEELNSSLERKVEERTEQLQKSLNEVRELKVQQDGDYYLTSLLIHPLGGNFADGENVQVDMLVRQKKRFTFRKWEAEIGGDLCTAHSIELRGKRYTVFLNGDAMGKSIQGAGGALVLGVVFKSVITRTHLSSQARDRRPERWLKDCFLELQNIFVTFDGSMLISAVMGLLDEQTGALYYINAEHPWVCLYREGKAQFIEDQLLLRKIGIEGLEGQLQVRVFPLKPDDVILLGSDGRDDVATGVDERGNRIINEDEYKFLRNVEKGRGFLPEIEEQILAQGQLTDDFTLIRIGYREDRPAQPSRRTPEFDRLVAKGQELLRAGDPAGISALEQAVTIDPEATEVWRDLGRAHRRLRQYEKAAVAYLRATDLNPSDNDLLYQTAYTCKLAGRTEQALDLGESVRLREPGHVRNLINLADAYRMSGNLDRAQKILSEAFEYDPEHSDALRLQELLNSTPRPA